MRDISSLQEIVKLYGLRGIAAYAHHAQILGQENAEIYQFTTKTLTLLGRSQMELGERVQLAPECGRINLLAMEALIAAILNILAIQSRLRCHRGTMRANASWYQAMTSGIWRKY